MSNAGRGARCWGSPTLRDAVPCSVVSGGVRARDHLVSAIPAKSRGRGAYETVVRHPTRAYALLMPVNTTINWDERYATPDFLYGTTPNQYLCAQRHRLAPASRVLVAADGEGRNGVWLAQQGHTVTSVDQSAVGQKKAIDLARARAVSVEFVCADLSRWSPPGAPQYDAAIAIFAHFPAAIRGGIHATLVRALRPGGLLILEAFHVKQLGRHSGGPKDRDMLYEAAVLQRDFAALTTLELTEGTVVLDEGAKHQGEGYVVRFVGRRD